MDTVMMADLPAIALARAGRTSLASALFGLSALLLVACQPTPPPNLNQPAVNREETMPAIVSDEQTEVKASVEDDRLVLDVLSEAGIGNAEVVMHEKPGDGLRLRLHLAGLEEFRLTYGKVEVIASVSDGADYRVRQYVAVGQADAQPISPQSQYWLDIETVAGTGKSAADILPESGYYQVDLPGDFLGKGSDTFAIAWIDFYR